MNYVMTSSKLWHVFLGLCFLSLGLGCSDERATSQLPDTHPATWMDQESPDFHGKVTLVSGTISCSICHGDDLSGGWVRVSCIDCHLETGACVSCHGGLNDSTGAPPYGLRGEISDTTMAVGAHAAHLTGTDVSAAVACTSCHEVPSSLLEPGHLDGLYQGGGAVIDSIAEITWHGFADGGHAAWDRSARTCTGTYCHGGFTGGNTSNAPVWTESDQALCGSCHDVGDNPAVLGPIHELHIVTNGLVCADCHAEVINPQDSIVQPSLHVNGTVEFVEASSDLCDVCHGSGPEACTHCHGGVDNTTGAPPLGLRGEMTTDEAAVGAHTIHLDGGSVADGFACNQCHLVPSVLTDPGHWAVDSVAELTWGPLAGAASQWNPATLRCSNVYCHGNFTGGYAANSPLWTVHGQAGCGSCHDVGARPQDLSGRHEDHVVEENVQCYQCHATTVNSGLSIIGTSVHVDGQKTVVFAAGTGIYSNGSCSNTGCHGTEHW